MKKRKKRVWVALPPVLALSMIAGNAFSGQGPVLAAPAGTESDPKSNDTDNKDLRTIQGYDVRIVNWYEEPHEPSNQYEKDLYLYREEIQKKYNFTIHTDNIGGWGEGYTTLLSSSITAGEPVGQICTLEASWFPALFNSRMMAPLDSLSNFDFGEEKWNRGVLEATTVGGRIYGMAVGHEPRYGIFYNKRLLQEAGYGAETLYDLQKDGTWTWSKFEEVLKACTRDTNNDGITDTWGLVGYNYDYFTAAIYASGADFITKDAEGHFINQMGSDDFLKALNWANDTWQNYAEPQPINTNWDYFKDCFNQGEAAMRVTEEYAKAELTTMSDDWGFVMFPSPDGQELIATEREEVMFIPSSYSDAEANDIAFAFDLYSDPVPGYEGSDFWKGEYYSSYPDARAVDETLARMRNGKIRPRLELYVHGLEDALGEGFFWDIAAGAMDPAEAIKSQMPTLKRVIRDQNDRLTRVYGISQLQPEQDDEELERPAISIGVSGIASPTYRDYSEKWEGDYVYFGKYDGAPVKYRVLAPQTDVYGGRTMLLDCDNALYLAPIDKDGAVNEGATKLNEWQYSDLRASLNGEDFLLDPKVFSEAERNAIASSVIASHELLPQLSESFEGYTPLTGEKIFLLDAEDLLNQSYGYPSDNCFDYSRRKYKIGVQPETEEKASTWWLRSASADSKAAFGYVSADGDIFNNFDRVGMERCISPAFNVDLTRVLLSSMIAHNDNEQGVFKLTLLDDEIRLHVLKDTGVKREGNALTLSYSVAGKHQPNRLSILVLDRGYVPGNSDTKVLQYKELALDGPIEGGAVTIELDPEWGEDCYVYLVAEDAHDLYETDYASAPVEIFPSVAFSEEKPTEPEPTEEVTTEASTVASTEDATTAPTVAPTETAQEASGNSILQFFLWGGIVLFEFFVIVELIIYMRRRKKEE